MEVTASTESTTFCPRGTYYGTSSAATLLAENINSSKLMKVKLKDRSKWLSK